MATDNIDFVDSDYTNLSKEAMPHQIKTRKSSFESIRDKFDQFRIDRLYKKIDDVVYKTASDTYTEEDVNDKIMKRALLIARLENKIKILSYEDVPYNYVSRRAIKLRNNMMDRLVFNSDGIYSIYVSDEDYMNANDSVDLFDNVSDVSVNIPKVVDNNESSGIEVESENLDRDSITNAINDSFANVENDNSQFDNSDEVSFVSPEQVREFVGDSSENGNENDGIENIVIDGSISDDASSIDNPVNSLEDIDIDADDVKTDVRDALNEMRVSRSEASSAKIDKYDDNGSVKNENVSIDPVSSDDDSSLGFEDDLPFEVKKVNAMDIFNPVRKIEFPIKSAPMVEQETSHNDERDVPIVVNDRSNDVIVTENDYDDDLNEQVFDDVDKNDSSIDLEDDGVDKVNLSSSVAGKISEFSQLRDRALELKRKKQIVSKNREDIQLSAEKVAKRAEEAKKIAQKSQSELDSAIEELRVYCSGLEKDCNDTIKATEIVENDIKMNSNFIAMQEGKVEENSRIIDEINLLIDGGPLDDEQNKMHM